MALIATSPMLILPLGLVKLVLFQEKSHLLLHFSHHDRKGERQEFLEHRFIFIVFIPTFISPHHCLINAFIAVHFCVVLSGLLIRFEGGNLTV